MKKKLFLFLVIIMLILSISYIVYRIFFTLPLQFNIISIIFSIILLILEIWCLFEFLIYCINHILVKKTDEKTANMQLNEIIPEVDVFIATYNEPEKILVNTIEACKNMDYPNKSSVHIYLCDDGNRSDIKKLCKKMEINYITRKTRNHFKAGNYNNALEHSSSPYIATFDADMVPTRDFLLKTIPYFIENDKLGFVQAPQSFTNPDIYQYRFYLENDIPFEQEDFYRNIQTSNNAINAPVCCGTNVVFSRKALLDIGGFARKTITEDIATGLLIQNKGYNCIAINDIIAYGISVQDFDGFIKQRSRWAIGSIQMFKNYNAFKLKNLSLRQKLQYFSYTSYWLFGLKRLLFIILPLLFSFFNIILLDANMYVFAFIWLLTALSKKLVLCLSSKDICASMWNTIHEIILCPILASKVLKAMFTKKEISFEVSPKEKFKNKLTPLNLKVLLIHIILFVLNIIALLVSSMNFNNMSIINFVFSVIWIFYNTFYLIIAIIFDINNRNDIVTDFTPNKVTKYSLKSILKIFRIK